MKNVVEEKDRCLNVVVYSLAENIQDNGTPLKTIDEVFQKIG